MTAFDPTQRLDFGEALVPPDGYRLDAAIGTSFSMDFPTALTVPVAMALRDTIERDEIRTSPLAALAAMQRLEKRILICVEAGNIHTPSGRQTPLVSLLEGMVAEIQPPQGASFHPKVWVLRFRPTEAGLTKEVCRQRLILMSRNLTRDRSWDFALRLDGVEQPRKQPVNDDLVSLMAWLIEKVKRRDKIFSALVDGLAHVKWDPVPGFGRPSFRAHFPGTARLWRPGGGDMAVISPFCDDAGLRVLGLERIKALVANEDWLAGLKNGLPPACYTLADHAQLESEPEATPTAEGRAGLHAKIFVVEQDDRTEITLGSGNATGAGLGAAGTRNVEVFATLHGPSEQVGGIGTGGVGLLGQEGLGPLLQEWHPRVISPDEDAARRFDDAVRSARHLIFAARPTLLFEPEGERYSVSLEVKLPDLPEITGISVRLVTQDDLIPLAAPGPWSLGSVRLAGVTTFVQFSLAGSKPGQTATFVTQGLARELPKTETRLQALLQDMIRTPEKLLQFVTAMLEGRPDLDGMGAGGGGGGGERGERPREMPPVLETMLAAWLAPDGRERLVELDRLLGLVDALGSEVLKDFRALWDEFRKVLRSRT